MVRTREKVNSATQLKALVVLITLLVVPLRASEQGAEVCSRAHHVEWWEECAHAILEGERGTGGNDRWMPTKQGPPESRFSTEFSSECEHLRTTAAADGRSLVESDWPVTAHDASRCPCTVLEHQEWVEKECVARIDQVLLGMRRWEVMDLFELDGGVHGPATSRLRHPECPMLKVDVEFDMPNGRFDRSPRDLVMGVSAPYLEYLISD